MHPPLVAADREPRLGTLAHPLAVEFLPFRLIVRPARPVHIRSSWAWLPNLIVARRGKRWVKAGTEGASRLDAQTAKTAQATLASPDPRW
jgi:hypothetical protein